MASILQSRGRVVLKGALPVTPRRMFWLVLALVLGAAGALLLQRAGSMFLVLYLGLVLAAATTPAVDRLARLRLTRATATVIVFSALAAGGAVAVFMLLPLLEAQAVALSRAAPGFCDALQSWVAPRWLSAGRAAEFGARCRATVASTEVPAMLSWSSLHQLPGVLWTLMVLVVTAFVWTRDRAGILRSAFLVVATSKRAAANAFVEELENRLGAFVRAQVALSLVVGTVTTVFCWIVGLPNALLLGSLAAVGEALPVVGPLIVGALMMLIALGHHPEALLTVLLFAVLLRGLVDYVLLPLVIGRSTGVNPFLLLLVLLALGSTAGIVGVAAAAPVAAFVQLLLRRYFCSDNPLGDAREERNHAALLAYKARVIAIAASRLARRRAGQHKDARLECAVEGLALELSANFIETEPAAEPQGPPL